MARVNDWSGVEFNLFTDAVGHYDAVYNDEWTQTLYDAALFNWDTTIEDRGAILDALREHMWDQYGVDFDAVFDWEGYRDSYDPQG